MKALGKLTLVTGIALLAWNCGEAVPPEATTPLTVIVGAKLIDGTAGEPVDDAVIVIEGTRIREAGSRANTPVPKGAEIIDGAGKVVIPGLIDLHVHYFGDSVQMERDFRAQLYYGVTTVRSIGVDTEARLAGLREAQAGKIAAPRVYTAGLGFTAPGGHPVALEEVRRPASEEEAQSMVRELAAQKVDFTKMWVDTLGGTVPKITPEIRAAIVLEAQKHGIRAVAHIADEADVRQLAEAGVTDFLHTVADKEPLDEAFLAMCKSKGIAFTPTLTVLEHGFRFAEEPALLDDPEVRMALAPELLADLQKPESREKVLSSPDLPKMKEGLEKAKRFVKQMHDAGIPLGLGSDSGAGNIPTAWGSHNELALLVAAGLTPLDAIRIGTSASAAIVSKGEPEFGTLQAGKLADLIVLSADPLEDIHNSRKIERVMQAGEWVDRAALREQSAAPAPAPTKSE